MGGGDLTRTSSEDSEAEREEAPRRREEQTRNREKSPGRTCSHARYHRWTSDDDVHPSERTPSYATGDRTHRAQKRHLKDAEPPEKKFPTQHHRRLPLHPEQKVTAKPPPRMQNQPQPHHPQLLPGMRIPSGLRKILARSCTAGRNTASAPTATGGATAADVSETMGVSTPSSISRLVCQLLPGDRERSEERSDRSRDRKRSQGRRGGSRDHDWSRRAP